MERSNDEVTEAHDLVGATYLVLNRVHRLVRVMGALITVVLALLAFQYVQQNNLADDQASTLETDRRLEELLTSLEDVVTRVDTNTADVAAYVAEIRARAATQGGTNAEVARRLVLIDRIAAALGVEEGP